MLSSPSPKPSPPGPNPDPKPKEAKNPKSYGTWGDTIITWAITSPPPPIDPWSSFRLIMGTCSKQLRYLVTGVFSSFIGIVKLVKTIKISFHIIVSITLYSILYH